MHDPIRQFFRDLSLRKKLTLIIMATTGAALALAYGAFIQYDIRDIKKTNIRHTNVMADMVGFNCTVALLFDDSTEAAVSLASLADETNIERAVIYRPGYEAFAKYTGSTFDSSEADIDLRSLARAPNRTAVWNDNLYVLRNITVGDSCIGYVLMESDLANQNRRVANFILIGLLLGGGSLIVAMLLTSRLQAWVSQPILQLAEVARRVKTGQDYSVRAIEYGRDEIGALICGFNEMLSEIQSRESALKAAQLELQSRAVELECELAKRQLAQAETMRVKELQIELHRRAEELESELAERQRAQAETMRVKEFLQDVINSTPAPLVAVDIDGRITLWNRILEQETGLSGNKLERALAWEVIPILADHSSMIVEAMRSGTLQKRERVVTKQGTALRYVDVLVYPLHSDDTGAVIRLDDVTEEVRMLELMAQTEKMMTVGGLAAGMAHEINNPLGIIIQSIQNVQRRIAPDLPKNAEVAREVGVSVEGIQHYFEKRDIPALIRDILDAGKRAATIVTNMLDFSRRSSSGILPASIGDIIHKAVGLAANDYDLKKRYDFRHINIVYDISPTLPPVPCIESKLEQVILNLLKNAAQAIGEHGSENAPMITCRAIEDSGSVRIEIEDNGPGMPEDVRRRVFEPFFTTKEVGMGTGLGLSVSYFIVKENHKGTMSVESVPGKGTKFVIRLPLEHKASSRVTHSV
jgi:PAS domain S-box-containing protein